MKIQRIIFTLFVLLLYSIDAIAQAPGFGDAVDDVPLDGGIGILLAAAIGSSYNSIKRKLKTTAYK
jgi:hypothetical protein